MAHFDLALGSVLRRVGRAQRICLAKFYDADWVIFKVWIILPLLLVFGALQAPCCYDTRSRKISCGVVVSETAPLQTVCVKFPS